MDTDDTLSKEKKDEMRTLVKWGVVVNDAHRELIKIKEKLDKLGTDVPKEEIRHLERLCPNRKTTCKSLVFYKNNIS